jgi:isoamylase
MVNAFWENLNFHIQEGRASDWIRVADTSMPSPYDLLESGREEPLESQNYTVKARSIAVLLKKP